MITCPKCGYTREPHDLAPEHECPGCGVVYARFTALADLRDNIRRARTTGDWSKVPPEHVPAEAAAGVIAGMPVTTGLEIPGQQIEAALDVVSAECALGMNLLKDFLAGAGAGEHRSAAQTVLRDARKKLMQALRGEAFAAGGHAVIGVGLDYSEVSGGGKNSMLLVVATGTAVKLKR